MRVWVHCAETRVRVSTAETRVWVHCAETRVPVRDTETIPLLKSRWIIPSLIWAVKLAIYLDLLTPSLPHRDPASASFYSCLSNYPVHICYNKRGRVITLSVLSVCLSVNWSELPTSQWIITLFTNIFLRWRGSTCSRDSEQGWCTIRVQGGLRYFLGGTGGGYVPWVKRTVDGKTK